MKLSTTTLAILMMGLVAPFYPPQVLGQDDLGKANRTQTRRRRFFKRPIDYWRAGEKYRAPEKTEPQEYKSTTSVGGRPLVVVEDLWASPQRLDDGRWVIYTPPPRVRAFLENPTEETLKAYLAWKLERTLKMQSALRFMKSNREEVIAELLQEMDIDPKSWGTGGLTKNGTKSLESGSITGGKRTGSGKKESSGKSPAFTLVYFHSSG